MSALSWTAVLELLRRVPRGAWQVTAVVVMLAALAVGVFASIDWIRADEREQVLAEGRSVNNVLLQWQRETAAVQLDSARRHAAQLRDSVQRHTRIVYRWASLLPDSLRRAQPVVDSLASACTRLARDCDSLRTATARVDTLWRTVTSIDSTALNAARLTVVQRDGRIAALEARTCTVPTGVGTAAGAVLGFLVGRKR